MLDDDAGGVARVVDRREADEQPVIAKFPRSALTVAGAEPADLRGARLARHRDAVERQAAAHRGARALDDQVHALARNGAGFGPQGQRFVPAWAVCAAGEAAGPR